MAGPDSRRMESESASFDPNRTESRAANRQPSDLAGQRLRIDSVAWPVERLPEALAEFDREELPPVPDAPKILDQLMRHALILIGHGEMRLAMRLLRNALMRDSRNVEALHWMAFCLKDSGRLEDAAKCARALFQARPDGASCFTLGEILYGLERDGDAKIALEEALRLAHSSAPYLFEALKLLGNIHVRAGDLDAAEECYNKAFVIDPTSDALLVNYGTLEIQRENLDGALSRFRQALEINRENDRAWVGLALVHRQMGDAALAWANLERALDAAPTNRTALRLAVDWGASDRDFSVASRRLQAHLALQGDDAEMSFALAKIFAFARRFSEARLEAERAIALEPKLEGAAPFFDALRAETVRAREMRASA